MFNEDAVLPWLHPYWQILTAYQQQQRMPQALLISGNEGLGKRQLAQQFAQSLLCKQVLENGLYCQQCSSCHLFQAHTHPDYFIIQPEETGKQINIGQIRHLIAQLELTSQYAGNRVVIIHPAQQMNAAAANSFLKCLEEPVAGSVILLVSEQPSLLPATITSRCQKLTITPPKQTIALAWLEQQQVIKNQQIVLQLAQGSPLLAKQLAEQDIVAVRNQCFKEWVKVFKQQLCPLVVAENWQNYDLILLNSWLTTWVMDLIRYCYQQSSPICYNSDVQASLQELTEKVDLKGLFDFYQLLLQSKHRLNTQLNKQLLFEELLINWSQTITPGS